MVRPVSLKDSAWRIIAVILMAVAFSVLAYAPAAYADAEQPASEEVTTIAAENDSTVAAVEEKPAVEVDIAPVDNNAAVNEVGDAPTEPEAEIVAPEPETESAPEPEPEAAPEPEPEAAPEPEPEAAPEPEAEAEATPEAEAEAAPAATDDVAPAAKPANTAAAPVAAAPKAPAARTSAADDTSTADNTSNDNATTKEEPKYAQVKKLLINEKAVKLTNDGKFRLKVTLIPDIEGKKIEDRTITWSISDPKIASITEKGVVQGKTAGVVIVTATAANGKTVRAKVRVKIIKSQMAKRIPVLTYHRIVKDSAKRRFYNDTNLALSASLFNKQMKWLKKHGYRTISTAEFRDWRVNGTFLPKKSVLITIDDGFYETYHVAYPILKKYKFKATSFLIGKKIKATTASYKANKKRDRFIGRDVIQELAEEYPNLEFQSHTYSLHKRGKSGNGRAKFWSLKDIKKDFGKMEKYNFTAAAWPFGHTSKNLKTAAKASKFIKIGFGYMMDWAATRTSPLYNIPRFKVFGDRGLGDFTRIVKKAG